MKEKWINRWFSMCEILSSWSEDESTKVGCVVVSKTNDLLSIGWNGLPRGIKHTTDKNERPLKYKFFEHAESNAVANSSRNGISLKDSILFIPHFPCSTCARLIIQSGISEVYVKKTLLDSEFAKRWEDEIRISTELLHEAGIIIHKIC